MTTEERKPKFNVGDHIAYTDSYWGKRTGIVTESLGIISNIDGPAKDNFAYRFKDDVTGNETSCSEKRMKLCKK